MRVRHLFSCIQADSTGKPQANVKDKTADSKNNADNGRTIKELQIEEPDTIEQGNLRLQIVAAISVSLAMMGCGSHLSWTSPALPYLEGPESSVPITAEQASWIASVYTLGSLLGSLLSPLFIDRLGRKRSLLAFALPQLASWCLIISARSYRYLYAARVIGGLAHGGIYNAAVIYLAEIADRRVRGAFGTLLKFSTNLGGLFVTSFAVWLSYAQLNLVALSLPILFLASFVFLPETPHFYLLRGREDRATSSLLKLRQLPRNKPGHVRADIEAMRAAIESYQLAGGDKPDSSGLRALRDVLTSPSNRRGLWILLGLKGTQQLSGHMAIVAYTQEIFEHSGCSLPPEQAVVLLGLFQLLAGLAAASLIDRAGRRPLIILSGCSAALALSCVGLFFYLKYEAGADVSGITWLPVAALITYEVMVALGIGTIPYVILGEIFPTSVRGAAVSLGIVVGSILAFAVGLGFKALNTSAGIHTTFWVFAACCITGTIFVFFITPETKGKSLEEIQELFAAKFEPESGQNKPSRQSEQPVDVSVQSSPQPDKY